MNRKPAQPIRSGPEDREPPKSAFRGTRRLLTLGACLALLWGWQGPAAATAALRPMTVAVTATGSIPGIDDSDLIPFLASTMNSASGGRWHFAPAAAAAGAMPPDRIEWSIKLNASAAGSVRTYGFSRATMQRLLGVHQFLTIEVTLYLNGQYQTQSLIEANTAGGAEDPDLAAHLVRTTQQLMAWVAANDEAPPLPPRK